MIGDDFLVLYMDTGKEIGKFNKHNALDKLVGEYFGELAFSPKEKTALGADWSQLTIQKLIDRGKRLLILSNQETSLAFDIGKLCGYHTVLDAAKPLDPKQLYNGNIMRVYQSALRYISMKDDGTLSNELPTLLTSDNIPTFVKSNVNLIAPDTLDMSMIKSTVWTWADEKESSFNHTSSNIDVAFIKPDGRWYKDLTSSWIACYHRQKKKWQLIDSTKDSSCDTSNGFEATSPLNPYENDLLIQEMKKQKITTPIQVTIPLSSSPSYP